MTALLDFPTISELPVRGASALVPGTSLRLPLPPEAVSIPLDDRCVDCAGTGISFVDGALISCLCMGLFGEPSPALSSTLVGAEYGPGRPVDPADLVWPRPCAVVPYACDPS